MRELLRLGTLAALLLTANACFAVAAMPDGGGSLVDSYLQRHWENEGIIPAQACDDATFLRRITLDLAGRIPTRAEVDAFLADTRPAKRAETIESLLNGPEFSAYFAYVLDDLIQGSYAGSESFQAFLQAELQKGTKWDEFFGVLMIGPWDDDASKQANRFLDKRARDLNRLTVDATRVFFGVDISCAQCHDHPLVDDWKQDHYYGMASFFNRTTGGKGTVGEKNDGEVKFLAASGEEQTARLMFLNGSVVEEPAKSEVEKKTFSRRAQLVEVALDDRAFFSKAFVNQLWQEFFGRGLVHPVDQMHSGNAPSVPGLLEALADDFQTNSYDIRRLVRTIVSSQTYQKSSIPASDPADVSPGDFAVAQLRPLRPRQLAVSLLIATGNTEFDASSAADELRKQIDELTKKAAPLAQSFDPRINDFQSSTGEALFLSNNSEVQQLLSPTGSNLVKRLDQLQDVNTVVDEAILAVFTRKASEVERIQLSQWLSNDQNVAVRDLVWALITSAEFRFTH